jgi:hypothetical protein
MTDLSSIEYPHWLMIAGALLLVLGFFGMASRQRRAWPNRTPWRVIGSRPSRRPT